MRACLGQRDHGFNGFPADCKNCNVFLTVRDPDAKTFQVKDTEISETYDRLAGIYEDRWSFYVERSNEETLKRLDLGPDGTLLDIGCGTGILLKKISEQFPSARLHGLDASNEMLNVAKSKGFAAELLCGSAAALPFEDGTFDHVVSVSSFHYWRDPETSLKEILRVLKPHGKLVITDWCDDFLFCKICDLYLRLVDRAHYKTYTAKACRGLMDRAGFDVRSVEKYKINWLWGFFTATAVKPG